MLLLHMDYNRHQNLCLTLYCKVVSNKSWHRCNDVDDCVGITYTVLPQI